VKKDNIAATHPHITTAEAPVNNLEVMNLMKSLKSRGYIRMTFSWQYYYCYLTPEGIEYLRTYLALPPEIVPATHKKTVGRPEGRDRDEDVRKFGGPSGQPAFRGDNDREYRPREGGFGRGGGM
jgi:small subunit ribosomal protein S10e